MNSNAFSLPPVDVIPFVKKPVYKSLHPLTFVKIDGRVYRPKRWEISSNAHGATDTGSVRFPISGYPDWSMTLLRDASIGNANKPVEIEIFADPMGQGNYVQRFSGLVDYYEPILDESNEYTEFYFRSKAAKLTSDKITTPFGSSSGLTDQSTTVAFIQQQAAAYGLTPIINLAPGQQPGTMLQVLGSEFVTGVRNWVKWQLMLQCAQFDDVDIWVDRRGNLNYQAAAFIERNVIQYVWGENVKSLRLRHSPQFSKNIRVEVRSYTPRTVTSTTTRVTTALDGGIDIEQSSRIATGSPIFGTTSVVTTSINSNGDQSVTGRNVTGGASSSGFTNFATEGGQERYIFYIKNATPTVCNDTAQRLWRQISMHEYGAQIVAPVTEQSLAVMDVTALVQLYGAPMAAFNYQPGYGQYWPRTIRETFDTTEGWFWEIDGVNHELPQGEV